MLHYISICLLYFMKSKLRTHADICSRVCTNGTVQENNIVTNVIPYLSNFRLNCRHKWQQVNLISVSINIYWTSPTDSKILWRRYNTYNTFNTYAQPCWHGHLSWFVYETCFNTACFYYLFAIFYNRSCTSLNFKSEMQFFIVTTLIITCILSV